MYRVATRYSMNTYSIGDSPLGAAQLLSVTETHRIIITILMLPCTRTSLSPMKMCANCTLPMVPCGSSPVARLDLAKNEVPEEKASSYV